MKHLGFLAVFSLFVSGVSDAAPGDVADSGEIEMRVEDGFDIETRSISDSANREIYLKRDRRGIGADGNLIKITAQNGAKIWSTDAILSLKSLCYDRDISEPVEQTTTIYDGTRICIESSDGKKAGLIVEDIIASETSAAIQDGFVFSYEVYEMPPRMVAQTVPFDQQYTKTLRCPDESMIEKYLTQRGVPVENQNEPWNMKVNFDGIKEGCAVASFAVDWEFRQATLDRPGTEFTCSYSKEIFGDNCNTAGKISVDYKITPPIGCTLNRDSAWDANADICNEAPHKCKIDCPADMLPGLGGLEIVPNE